MSDDFTNSSQRLGLLLHFSSVDDFQSALNTLLYLPIHLWNLYRTSVCSTLSITHTFQYLLQLVTSCLSWSLSKLLSSFFSSLQLSRVWNQRV